MTLYMKLIMFWNDVPRSIDMVLLGFLDVGPDVIG